jgi:hypothetical protein
VWTNKHFKASLRGELKQLLPEYGVFVGFGGARDLGTGMIMVFVLKKRSTVLNRFYHKNDLPAGMCAAVEHIKVDVLCGLARNVFHGA